MPYELPVDSVRTNDGAVLQLKRLDIAIAKALIAFSASLDPESKRRFTPHEYDGVTVSRYVERVDNGLDATFVALDPAGDVVAYFFLWEMNDPVPVLGIGIAGAYQGRGLGSRLMELLKQVARDAGKTGIDLTTMQDNDRAFALYRSVGFEYVGDVSNRTGDGRVVVERRMFLPITPGAEPSEREFHAPV